MLYLPKIDFFSTICNTTLVSHSLLFNVDWWHYIVNVYSFSSPMSLRRPLRREYVPYTAVDWHGKLHFRRENRKQNVYYVYEICSTILSEFKVILQPPFGQFGGKLAKHKQTQQQKTQCVVFRKRVLIHLMIMTIWKHPFLLVQILIACSPKYDATCCKI